MKLSIGVDYGTNSVRAIVVDCADGKELGSAIFDYKRGNQGVISSPSDSNLARQSPLDYLEGLEFSISNAIKDAKNKNPEICAENFIGMGFDTTGSTPLPVAQDNSALAQNPEFADNPNAQAWLWKDHTSHVEAEKITAFALKLRPQYMEKCGGKYSSEWLWSKIWHCLNVDKKVFEAAHSWVELCDWIPSVLAGIKDTSKIVRSVCAAGHKAMYCEEWGGLPDEEFLKNLAPELVEVRAKLYEKAYACDKLAGFLCAEWAEKLGLPENLPIAVGEFDTHYGAVGCGVKEGVLIRTLGTSACDCLVVPVAKNIPNIEGICGIVEGSVLPNFYGIEAGQPAVGDIFKWWVETVLGESGSAHKELRKEAEKILAGESGLIALDWNNGNRSVLDDQRLTGLILGQTLHTSRAEIYRALIEATAFGARVTMERFFEYGISIDKIIYCGGIAEKDPMTMQIYADVANMEIFVSRSPQTCALGAAIAGAVAGGAHDNFNSAQSSMTGVREVSYKPIPENAEVYDRLFKIYKTLYDAFGGVSNSDMGGIMKELLKIKEERKSKK